MLITWAGFTVNSFPDKIGGEMKITNVFETLRGSILISKKQSDDPDSYRESKATNEVVRTKTDKQIKLLNSHIEMSKKLKARITN